MSSKAVRLIISMVGAIFLLGLSVFLYLTYRGNTGLKESKPPTKLCSSDILSATKLNFEFLIGSSLYGYTILVEISNNSDNTVIITNKQGQSTTSALTDSEYKNLVEKIRYFICTVKPVTEGDLIRHSPLYKMVITTPARTVTVTDDGNTAIDGKNYNDSDLDNEYLPIRVFENFIKLLN